MFDNELFNKHLIELQSNFRFLTSQFESLKSLDRIHKQINISAVSIENPHLNFVPIFTMTNSPAKMYVPINARSEDNDHVYQKLHLEYFTYQYKN